MNSMLRDFPDPLSPRGIMATFLFPFLAFSKAFSATVNTCGGREFLETLASLMKFVIYNLKLRSSVNFFSVKLTNIEHK